jgi:hypothetical protein
MKKPIVKLNNGTKVPLEEFVTWTSRKQTIFTLPGEIRQAMIKKKAKNTQRAINTPIGQFSCFEDAKKALNLGTYALRSRLRNTAYPEYNFVNPKPSDLEKEIHQIRKRGRKFTVTPLGIFRSKVEAYSTYGIKKGDFEDLLKQYPDQYYYLDEKEALKLKQLK